MPTKKKTTKKKTVAKKKPATKKKIVEPNPNIGKTAITTAEINGIPKKQRCEITGARTGVYIVKIIGGIKGGLVLAISEADLQII